MKTKRLLILPAFLMLFSFAALAVTDFYQAEDNTARLNATNATSNLGYNGTGYTEMTNANGNYFEWNNVSAASTGTADIRFRYTNADGSQLARSCDIIVNGTVAGSYIFPFLDGGWAGWAYSTQVMTVNLNTGLNTIRVQINNTNGGTGKSPKVDEMEVVMGAPTVFNVTSVAVDPSNFGIFVGGTALMKTFILPVNATDKTVTWATDNAAIAAIDATTGYLTAVSEGLATITATSTDGGFVGSCTVGVYPLTASTGLNANIILNPDFEGGLTWWSDWTGMTLETVNVAGGLNAAKVSNGVAGGFGQDIAITGAAIGKTYLASVKVNTANTPISAQAGFKVFEGATALNSPYYVTSIDAVYTTYSWIVATTAATTKVQAWVYKSAAGDIFLDDFSFAELSTVLTGASAANEVKTLCFMNNNQLFVNNSNGVKSVSIYNTNGQSMLNKTLNSNENSVNVNSLNNGLYIVKVNLQNGSSEFVKVLKK